MHHTKRDPRYHQNRRRTPAVLEQIREKTNFPAETLIEGVEGHNFRFEHKFRWMRGSRIVLP
jgi:hypothetical protein